MTPAERSKAYYYRHHQEVRAKQNAYNAAHREQRAAHLASYRRTEHGAEVRRANAMGHRAEDRARSVVRSAVYSGSMVKGVCAVCENPVTHGHHYLGYDPEHRRDVVWLCAIHHGEAHRLVI